MCAIVSLAIDKTRLLVAVLVNGVPARALVDTGASISAVSTEYLSHLSPSAALRLRPTTAGVGLPIRVANDQLYTSLSTVDDATICIEFVVPKPHSPGEFRVVIDLRALNSTQYRVSQFNIPRPRELLEEVGTAHFISCVDLRHGFYQLGLDPSDRPRTAFTVDHQQYQYCVSPMGNAYTPLAFSESVNEVLRGAGLYGLFDTDGAPRRRADGSHLLDTNGTPIPIGGVRSYVDDIIIWTNSTDPADHYHLVRRLIKALADADMHLKLSKAHLFCREARFLGCILGHGALRVDPDKVAAVRNWDSSRFKSAVHVRSFLGVCNFHREHVPNFSAIARPLYDLTKKRAPWSWSEDCEVAFRQLQHCLCNAPVLRLPDWDRPFTLTTDSSNYAVGAVLSQHFDDGWHPISYFSSSLTGPHFNYSAREKECWAIIEAVKHFRHYLWGSRFHLLIQTDHNSLSYLDSQPELTGRMYRWAEELAQYRYEIRYLRGADNVVADALSRLPPINDGYDPALYRVPTSFSSSHPPTAAALASLARDVCPLDTLPPPFWADSAAAMMSTFLPIPVIAPVVTRASTRRVQGPSAPTAPTAAPQRRPPPPVSPADDIDGPQPRAYRISRSAYLEDPYFGPIFALLSVAAAARPPLLKVNPKWAHSLSRLQHYTIIDGQLHNYGILGDTALCVPDLFPQGPNHPSLRTVLIQSVHDPPDQGHRGTDITYARLRRRFFWRGMRDDTDNYVRSCTCQAAKSRTTAPYGLLQPPSQPLGPWATITMDLLTKLVPDAVTKHDTLLVVVDKCTKYVVLIACCESITGPDTIALLHKHIFSKFGYPLQVISDRDPRWTGHFFQHWCTARGIKHSMSSGNHPETDGLTERANRSIEEIARNYVQYDHGLFFQLLDDLAFAINDSPTQPTGRSPAQLLFGFNPLRPNDLHGPPPPSAHLDTRTRLEHQHAIRLEATDLYREAASRNTTIANRSRRAVPASFKPGALVWVHRDYITPPVRRQQQRVSGTGKLYPRYYGPYPIRRAIGSASFELKLPATFKCHPVFHASALKASQARADTGLIPASVTPLLDELGHELFEIETLLDRRVRHYKTVTRTTYLVKWRFYDLDEACWEPESSLPVEFVREYDRAHPR